MLRARALVKVQAQALALIPKQSLTERAPDAYPAVRCGSNPIPEYLVRPESE
jgi:hypothetical protein